MTPLLARRLFFRCAFLPLRRLASTFPALHPLVLRLGKRWTLPTSAAHRTRDPLRPIVYW